jgi:hypothetical protein
VNLILNYYLLISIPSCHGVIFWENSTGSKVVFNIQKKVIRIMGGIKKESLLENYLRNLLYFPS